MNTISNTIGTNPKAHKGLARRWTLQSVWLKPTAPATKPITTIQQQ
ncbi:MAG: hypothetical protein HY918_03710 [Candidatus Doudnabacteria bacterium]|nr:hypothetical protein [Candidatus Doudnabacteria bacterium]